jgi:hypothetical protein
MSTACDSPVSRSDVTENHICRHPAAAPISRILPVAELCESILHHLSFHDLIRVQLVCRDLNAAIKSSPICQTTLFFRPTLNNSIGEWVADYKNRLFTGKDAQPYLEKIRNGSRNYNAVRPHLCNPMLSSPRHGHICNSRSKRLAVAVGINDHIDRPHHSHEYFEFQGKLTRNLEAHFSCRSMFLTQPPVTRIELEPVGRCEHTRREDSYLRPGWCSQCNKNKVIVNPDGVNLGQVVDETSRRRSQGKNTEPDRIRFPEAFVISQEVQDWMCESGPQGSVKTS